jgi:Holliday junction resolvase RusA-like endonuclease
MTKWSATLDGIRVISLKNCKRVVRAHGRTLVLPSKAHEAFLKAAQPQLLPHRPAEPFAFPYTLHITFHLKGKLDADRDNLCATVGDLLMASGIIVDDKQCMRLVADKRPGRVTS